MRWNTTPFGIMALCLTAIAAQARADVILSNLPGTPSVTGTNLGVGSDGADRTKGVGLTTGADPLAFESILVLMRNTGATPAQLGGGIFDSVSNRPSTMLAAFAPQDVPPGAESDPFTLTVPGGFTLAPSTTYWFVLDGPDTLNFMLWKQLTPNTLPTVSGVTYNGYRFSDTGGASWVSSSSFNTVTIRANAVPEPVALGLLAGAGLLALRRRG